MWVQSLMGELRSHMLWSNKAYTTEQLLSPHAATREPTSMCPISKDPTWCNKDSICSNYCEAARVNTMTGGLDLSFGFPRNGKIPYPHHVTWSQPINMRPVRNQGRAEKPANAQVWKKPWKFVPIKLLCKHVTNLLKPATDRLCIPYKFG